MTDSFDEAIYKIKYSGDFEHLAQQFGRQAAAAYLRENFIPRARVLALHKQLEAQWTVHGSYATMSAADLRELFEYLLK